MVLLVALGAVVVLAGCTGGDGAEDESADAAASTEASGDGAGDAGTEGPDDAADTSADEEDEMTEDGLQRHRSSGSERIVTDDAIATPAPRDGKASAAEPPVVEAAVADRCAGPGLEIARGEGEVSEPVAGYATVLGALASWRVEDGSSTRSVSIVDSSRPDDAEVAICYYDGRFAERAGREVTRVGVVVYDDGTGRVVLRGTPDTLGTHRPPTT